MKDYALELAANQNGADAKLNIMREYLQAYMLRVMQNEGALRSAAFLGGTALRFLYNLPRFSEDLDFSLVKSGEYNFSALIKKIQYELTLAGYKVSLTYNDAKTVHSAFIKFEELMHDAAISPLKNQKFSIKLDIDMNPPRGAKLKTEIVNKYFPISFLSYTIESLFAGKLHALLSRKYTKGRDFFDLGWYISKWKGISPNIELLSNALIQTGWKKEIPTEKNWRKFISLVVCDTDWKKVNSDAERFLENTSDINIFTKETILELLRSG